MALIKCDFFSDVLNLSTSMTVILPQAPLREMPERKLPVLYLLHGFSDDHTIWTRRTSIERYAEELGLAVIMPAVDHSFYTDMEYGKRYWTFLSEELPVLTQSMFPVSGLREDNFVAGLSMGGYGAFKWALRHPEKFFAAASLSGVLDIAGRVKDAPKDRMDGFYQVFGEKSIEGTENDLFQLIKEIGQKPSNSRPLLYQCCGTEDFLYEDNKRFLEIVKEEGIEVKSDFGPGDHEWGYWDREIQKVLEWLPLDKEKAD